MSKQPLQERVRARLRTLVETADVSHEILAQRLGLSRSNVSRMLTQEDRAILLPHLEGFCEFFQVTAAELVAEPGAQIIPVSPIEAALLALIRQMTELERRSLLTILERPPAIHQRKARLGRAMLTTREQELVDLFARVKKDAIREGVLKTLRGAAATHDDDHRTTE